MPDPFETLLGSVRDCSLCSDLPLGPKPLLQASAGAKVLLVGQAPGRITHAKGIPFDDPSGVRLRDWLGVSTEQFYDPKLFAIIPMGFCFPGTGKGGDLPPRPECAPAWRERLLSSLKDIELTVVIGRYAIDWHLPALKGKPVTQAVFSDDDPSRAVMVLPHPSPRNNRWLKNNPSFEAEIIPSLKTRVKRALEAS